MKTNARFLVHGAFLGTLALVLSACASMDLSPEGIANRAVNVATSSDVQQKVQAASQEFTPEQEYYIGRAVAANLLSTRKVWDNKAATDYVNLLERALVIYCDKPETFGGYHVLIMDSDEINAFSAPGGLILVTRGLLRCATSEGGVAAILAHETSHVVLGHGLKSIKDARSTQAALAVLGAAVPETQQLLGPFNDVVNDVVKNLVTSGYSRDYEFQADQMALQIMRRAGYDPQAFDAMLKLMKTKLKPGGLDFAKTHPDPVDREAAVEKTLSAEQAVTVPPDAAAERPSRAS
jgi:predicted Zn-dependent protease